MADDFWDPLSLAGDTGALQHSVRAGSTSARAKEVSASLPQKISPEIAIVPWEKPAVAKEARPKPQRRLSEAFCEGLPGIEALEASKAFDRQGTESTQYCPTEMGSIQGDGDGQPASEAEGKSGANAITLQVVPVIAGPNAEFLPTLGDAMSRYTDEWFNDNERQRMRLAFIRFAEAETCEVLRDSLYDILVHLGYCTVTEENARTVAVAISGYSTFDFQEFQEFVSKFARMEYATLTKRAAEFAHGSSGSHTMRGLQEFLLSLNLIACQEVLEEAGKLAGANLEDDGLSDDLHLDEQAILRILAAVRVTEGFTAEDVDKARGIYDELERLPAGRRSTMTGSPVKSTQLAEGLCSFFGPYYIDHLTVLATKMADSEDAPGLSFYEFLVWARRLRDLGAWHLRACFEKCRVAGQERVTVEGVLEAVAEIGFTLLEDAADELLQTTDLARGQEEGVDFPTFVRFVDTCRESNGFTQAEGQELQDLYSKFDYDGNEELESLEVLDMMRYQGHITKLDDVNNMIRQVDFNNNGTMDRDEYMRLMRLQREQVIINARNVFDRHRAGQAELPTANLAKILPECHIEVRSETLTELMRVHASCRTLKFDAFVRIVDRGQEIAASEGRKRAGLSMETFDVLKRLFRTMDKSNRGIINTGQLMRLLSELMTTLEHRETMVKSLDAARSSALEAGVTESELVSADAPSRTQKCSLWDFVHLVRGLVRENEEKTSARETEVIEQTKFTPAEVAQFRNVFGQMVVDYQEEERKMAAKNRWANLQGSLKTAVKGAADAPKPTRARSKDGSGGPLPTLKELLKDLASAKLPTKSISHILSSIGLTVSMRQREDLQDKLNELTEDADELDFACFLLLMRWMLDTDYANISGTAKKTVDMMKEKGEVP
jgi:Ca2+-binding EF-hand superfamily protein